jgi:hypothetical protein
MAAWPTSYQVPGRCPASVGGRWGSTPHGTGALALVYKLSSTFAKVRIQPSPHTPALPSHLLTAAHCVLVQATFAVTAAAVIARRHRRRQRVCAAAVTPPPLELSVGCPHPHPRPGRACRARTDCRALCARAGRWCSRHSAASSRRRLGRCNLSPSASPAPSPSPSPLTLTRTRTRTLTLTPGPETLSPRRLRVRRMIGLDLTPPSPSLGPHPDAVAP